MAVNPWAYDRAKLWGDVIARRLLADTAAGAPKVIGMGEIERACDAAIKTMIGRVDRERLLDEATRRFVELAAAVRCEAPGSP